MKREEIMKVPKARRLSSGTWFIQLRLGGESIPVTGQTERACTTQAQLIKAEYLAGKRDEKKNVPAPEKLPTLAQAIDDYISSKSNILSPSTIRGYRAIQKSRFQQLIDRSISDISDNDWQDALNREAAICSPKTLKNAWGLIGSVVRANGRTVPNVLLPQIPPNERPVLYPEQIKPFIAATNGDPYQIPALLALSSLRRSEICALQWGQVDLNRKRIMVKGAVVPDEHQKFVYKKANKNRTSTRTIPILMPELYDALVDAREPSGPVITCNPSTLLTGINRICDRAGLPHVGVHGLRHSFASLAFHLGIPDQIIMEMGGWSNLQTVRKIYTHISKADMNRYEAAFGDFFREDK